MLAIILRPLLLFLMVSAFSGFVFSLTLHLLAIIGLQPDSDKLLIGMFAAVVPIALPAIAINLRLTKGLGGTIEGLRVQFSAGPTWMRYINKALYVYAGVVFIVVCIAPFTMPSLVRSFPPDRPPRIFWILAS